MRKTFALVVSAGLGLTALAGAALAEKGQGLFGRSDTNGDGFVSKEEFAAGRTSMFSRLDANVDGTIDQAEIDKARAEWRQRRNKPADQAHAENQGAENQGAENQGAEGHGKKHRGMMQRVDTDGDGKITAAEFSAAGEKMFARLDDNGDGRIAKDELPKRHKKPHDAPQGEAPAQ